MDMVMDMAMDMGMVTGMDMGQIMDMVKVPKNDVTDLTIYVLNCPKILLTLHINTLMMKRMHSSLLIKHTLL
jgi:hypothetical protein